MQLDSDTAAFFETGVSMHAAFLDARGLPFVVRVWGASVEASGQRLRLVLPADEPEQLEHVREGSAVALIGSDVITYRSVQVKGRVVTLGPATADDERVYERHAEALVADIASEGTAPEVVRRVLPATRRAATIEIEAAFDQTPGPGAGGDLETSRVPIPRERR